MARSKFRICGKKRGDRRTGSGLFGRLGEAGLFASVLLVGLCGLAALFAMLVVPQWRAHHEFVRHSCRVLDKRVAEQESQGGTIYRPEVQIEYEVEGQVYRIWTYDLGHYEPGGGYTADLEQVRRVLTRFADSQTRSAPPYVCWYDPADPSVAVLRRASSWWIWVTFMVPLAFVLIGGGGLVYTMSSWGKSQERRAATSVKSASGSPPRRNGKHAVEYPHVPTGANITNSPGTRLAFRLPLTRRRTWAMFVTLSACVLWNGILTVFLVIAVGGFLQGEPDWWLFLLTVPFLVVGIGLIVYFVRGYLWTTGIGPTLVEISDQPLRPGASYQLFLSQTGRLRIKSLEMRFVCEEEATFQHGTNTRTETRRVHEQHVFRHGRFDVRRGSPFEADCRLEIPAGAMHSFKADHNEVRWKLVVKGTAERWPDYERAFPVVVCPGANGTTGR